MKLDMTYEDTWNTRTRRLAELGIGSYADYDIVGVIIFIQMTSLLGRNP